MEVMEAILTRRSIRSFTSQEISKQDLETIATAAIHAPSGMNRQSWQFTILTGDKIEALAEAIRKSSGNSNFTFYKPAALIVTSNEKSNERNGQADCACALQTMFLAAHSMGIGSVWINQLKGISDYPDIRPTLTALKIPESHEVQGIAALGYPASTPPAVNKDASKIIWGDA
jgi:Nitroreductase